MSERDAVRQFHEAMGIPVRERPTMPSVEERLRRARLVHEEAEEVIKALGCVTLQGPSGPYIAVDFAAAPVLAHIAQELADLRYVAHGGDIEAGIPPEVFAEVHRANLAKLGPDGKPVVRADGKVIKPPGWKPPDVATVLREHEP